MQRSRFRRQRRRAIASSILPVPELEVQQRPQQLFVVLPAADMLGQQPVENARVVVAPSPRRSASKVIEQILAHSIAEPVVDRNAEAHLGARENALGKQPPDGLPENPFPVEAPYPVAVRQR